MRMIIGIIVLIGLLVMIDWGTPKQVTETGTIVYTPMVLSGSYTMVHASMDPTHYGLVVIQHFKKRSYFMGVDRENFYQFNPGDKVLLHKEYGRITGWEYKCTLNLN